MSDNKRRIIIGITGASGVIMGCRLLEVMKEFPHVEIHLVMTNSALITLRSETDIPIDRLLSLADFTYDIDDFTAAIASGSFITDGMIVLPCSMKTLAGIANGFSANLLLRAADVCLKEGRTLVLSPREAPLSLIHLKNLLACKEAGAAIIPPMLTFYQEADTAEDQIIAHLGTVLRQFGLKPKGYKPWK